MGLFHLTRCRLVSCNNSFKEPGTFYLLRKQPEQPLNLLQLGRFGTPREKSLATKGAAMLSLSDAERGSCIQKLVLKLLLAALSSSH